MSHAKQLHNRRYLNDYLEIINREGLPGNVKNDVCRKVQATVIATVQHVIEAALDEELRAYLGVDRYEHVPWGRPPEATAVAAISGHCSRSTVPLLTYTCPNCAGVTER